MPDHYDFDLDPVSFITVGTQGPAGQRTFFLQAARQREIVSIVIEKEHAIALAVNLSQLIDDLAQHDPGHAADLEPVPGSMALIDPPTAAFRADSIGVGIDTERHMIVLVVGELVDEEAGPNGPPRSTVGGTRSQPSMWLMTNVAISRR